LLVGPVSEALKSAELGKINMVVVTLNVEAKNEIDHIVTKFGMSKL
jgi:hypothetical protein